MFDLLSYKCRSVTPVEDDIRQLYFGFSQSFCFRVGRRADRQTDGWTEKNGKWPITTAAE